MTRTLQILRGTEAQNDAFTGAAGELTMDTTNNQLRLHDGSTQGGHIIGKGYHPGLFAHEWDDHIRNDVQWLRADTFSWQDGSVYQAAYQHLVDDIDGKTAQTETIAGTTVTFYLADDGHKICPVAQESNVASIYAATGIAWYYIIDTTNTRFKLPRSKHNKYVSQIAVKGSGISIGLTSGSQDATLVQTNKSYGPVQTQLSGFNKATGSVNSTADNTMTNYWAALGITSDADKSGIVTDTIPEDTSAYKYLYFYVGEFTQTALENTAGLNAELFNSKVDKGHEVIAFQAPTAANNYTWYRKYADGWVEQGGQIASTVATSTSKTVNLPVTMANYYYFAVSNTQYAGNDAPNYGGVVKTRETTYITLGHLNGYNTTWEVKGMAA